MLWMWIFYSISWQDILKDTTCKNKVVQTMISSTSKSFIIIGLMLIVAVVLLSIQFHPTVVTLVTGGQGSSEDVKISSVGVFRLPDSDTSETIGKGPLSLLRQKGFVTSLAHIDLDQLSEEELLFTLHSNVDNTNVLCRRKIRLGKIGDGGWEVCDDPDVRPSDPCIVYSFGINYDFSFDDDAAKLYGCHVFSFDPSMSKEQDQYDRSPKVHFYKLGLDGRTYVNDIKWPLFTFQDIRAKLNHQNSSLDVVKIDIEHSEWPALPQIAASGQLADVKQLLLEYHINQQSRDYILPRLKALQEVERAGFRKFYVHKNPACKCDVRGIPVVRTACYEVHYMRR
ncbi:methyltransferase-like protein 24 [Biomphalaria pfeifferi]|uniref:Methyltransferase-like protein 24 n=1 Tax=Biomphalaria pfeifferi TaxID=112525 RepID=A0AAD8F3B1_BIOPF|nr:methyltransferase-like protein 24 [Biomphalaria pfeifferi]